MAQKIRIGKAAGLLKRQLAGTLIDEIRNQMKLHAKIATKEAYDSWYIDGNGNVATKSIGMYHIEYGRRPRSRMPPYEPILEWAKEIGIPVDEQHRFVEAARRKIANDGISPTRVVLRALFVMQDEWRGKSRHTMRHLRY